MYFCDYIENTKEAIWNGIFHIFLCAYMEMKCFSWYWRLGTEMSFLENIRKNYNVILCFEASSRYFSYENKLKSIYDYYIPIMALLNHKQISVYTIAIKKCPGEKQKSV